MKKNKNDSATGSAKHLTVVPTVCFVAISLLLVYAVFRLFGNFVVKELRPEVTPQTNEETAKTETPPPPEDKPVSIIIVPEETPRPSTIPLSPTPVQSGGSSTPATSSDPVSSEEAPLQQASPLPEKKQYAGVFGDSRMDTAVVCFSADGHLCCAALMCLDNTSCTLIPIPHDLLDAYGRKLSDTMTARASLEAIESVVPVSYTKYISIDTTNIAACVDTIGALTVDGITMNGEAVAAYLNAPDLSNAAYTARQEAFLSACIQKLRMTSLLRLAAAKLVVQRGIGGNLTASEFMLLYRALKALPVSGLKTLALPTQQAVSGQKIDTAALYKLLEELSFSEVAP